MKQIIAHINTASTTGGAATVARQLAEGQASRGACSKIFAHDCEEGDPYSLYFPKEAPAELHERTKKSGELYYDLQGSHRLLHHRYFKDSDILHLHNLHGGFFNYFSLPLLTRAKPTIWTLHDMQSFTGHCAHAMDCKRYVTGCHTCSHLDYAIPLERDNAHNIWRDKEQIYQKSILTVVAPSEWLAKRVRQSILREHPLKVIPNGVCTKTFFPFDRTLARKEFGLPEDGIILGSTAHFGVLSNPWKGGDLMVEALQKVWQVYPDAYFMNIGGTSPIQDKRIISIDHVTDKAVLNRLLSALDIFIYSSRADNCPLVILEAMAVGIPIVSNATGGVPELIEDGESGLLARYKNTDELAQGALRLIQDNALRERLGVQAREKAEKHYDIDHILDQYETLYDETKEHFHRKQKTLTPFTLEDVPEIIRTVPFRQSLEKDDYVHWQKRKQDAFQQFKEHSFEDSLTSATTLIQEDPSDNEIATLLGALYLQRGEHEAGIKLLRYAFFLNAENRIAHHLLSQILTGNIDTLDLSSVDTLRPSHVSLLQVSENDKKEELVRIASSEEALLPAHDDINFSDPRPRFLQIHTFYEGYLDDLYRENPELLTATSLEQRRELVLDGFSGIHMMAPYMHHVGYQGQLIVANDLLSQLTWAKEHGIERISHEDPERDLVRAQIDYYQPDILYLSDPIRFDGQFIKSLQHVPDLILGWRAAHTPEDIDWTGFDVMLSSLSALREEAVRLGARAAEHFWPAFPAWYYDQIKDEPATADLSFCGTWTTKQHPVRNKYITELTNQTLQQKSYTFNLHLSGAEDTFPEEVTQLNKGAKYGLDTYRAIRSGKMTFDARGEIGLTRGDRVLRDLAQNETANMRIFEVTGCGRLLITEDYENLHEIFEPEKEVVVYKNEAELYEKVLYYREHPEEAEAIAHAGLQRCFRDHSMKVRTRQLAEIIERHRRKNFTAKSTPQENLSRYKDAHQYLYSVEQGWIANIIKITITMLEQKRYKDLIAVFLRIEDQVFSHPLLVTLYAAALGSVNDLCEARKILEQGLQHFPQDEQILHLYQNFAVSNPLKGNA